MNQIGQVCHALPRHSIKQGLYFGCRCNALLEEVLAFRGATEQPFSVGHEMEAGRRAESAVPR